MADGKDGGGIKDRFKKFLMGNQQVSKTQTENEKEEFFTDSFWYDIAANSELEVRLARIAEAMEIVKSKHLDGNVINKLWIETRDLLQGHNQTSIRLNQLSFLKAIIDGQYKRLGKLRAIFFKALQYHNIKSDSKFVIQALEALTVNGKDVDFFETEIGPLVLSWLKNVEGNHEFLALLINIIKFNSTHLGQDVTMEIVCEMHNMCNTTKCGKEINYAIQVEFVV